MFSSLTVISIYQTGMLRERKRRVVFMDYGDRCGHGANPSFADFDVESHVPLKRSLNVCNLLVWNKQLTEVVECAPLLRSTCMLLSGMRH